MAKFWKECVKNVKWHKYKNEMIMSCPVCGELM